jgi:hypothetical protein
MTILNGGVFGRNPTFNNVTANNLSLTGNLIVNGEVITGLDYNGTWNASTNTPTLTSSVGTIGSLYIVSTGGSTALNGISNWGVGDWVLFNGSTWQRVEGGANGNFVDISSSGTATLTDVVANDYRLSSSGIITEATTSRTLSATDNGKIIYCTSGSATTITCAASLGAGFSCTIIQGGAGKVTVAAGGQTLVSYSSLFSTMGQNAVISAICPVDNTFILAGNLGV